MRYNIDWLLLFLLLCAHPCLGQGIDSDGWCGRLEKMWTAYLESRSCSLADSLYQLLLAGTPSSWSSIECQSVSESLLMQNHQLAKRIYEGDSNAVKVCFAVLKFADAALYEDLMDRIGAFITANPRTFLELVERHRQNVDLQFLLDVRMTSDAEAKEKIDSRIEALESVTEPSIQKMKTECLRILGEYKRAYLRR